MSNDNTVCEIDTNIQKKLKRSKGSKRSLTVDTNLYYKYDYIKAYSDHRIAFNWNNIREFKPKYNESFDFKLLKYDFDTCEYLHYYNNIEIEKLKRKNKTSKIKQKSNRVHLLSPFLQLQQSPDENKKITRYKKEGDNEIKLYNNINHNMNNNINLKKHCCAIN